MDRERDFRLDLAAAENPHPLQGAPQNAGFHHGRGVDLAGGVEAAGIDRLLQASQIDLVELARKLHVLEAALGQAPVQRHLAALEAFDAHAGARGLPLATAAAGLALAGADAAADAFARLARAGPVGEFVQFHCLVPSVRPSFPSRALSEPRTTPAACPARRLWRPRRARLEVTGRLL